MSDNLAAGRAERCRPVQVRVARRPMYKQLALSSSRMQNGFWLYTQSTDDVDRKNSDVFSARLFLSSSPILYFNRAGSRPYWLHAVHIMVCLTTLFKMSSILWTVSEHRTRVFQ